MAAGVASVAAITGPLQYWRSHHWASLPVLPLCHPLPWHSFFQPVWPSSYQGRSCIVLDEMKLYKDLLLKLSSSDYTEVVILHEVSICPSQSWNWQYCTWLWKTDQGDNNITSTGFRFSIPFVMYVTMCTIEGRNAEWQRFVICNPCISIDAQCMGICKYLPDVSLSSYATVCMCSFCHSVLVKL